MGFESFPQQKTQEKKLSKEDLTSLLKNGALNFDGFTRRFLKDPNIFIPKMNWNENAGVIVFTDENGETYATKSSNELRSALLKSHDYTRDEKIGVPAVNSPDGWESQKAFEDSWKNKHKESFS